MSTPVHIDQNSTPRQSALRFLFGRIDYERMVTVPYGVREFKLERMHELLARLGNPQQEFPIVHVAGTKGKGSTAAMIGAVLSAARYRTGVFTSPHLDRIEQRMAVDGEPCSAAEFVDLVEHLRPAVWAMDKNATGSDGTASGPTFFEITTATALLHFARRKVDTAVLEVGLGGRLDSTNACTPRLSVITSISFDHTRQLGHTLESIAREKAGIIKPGVPVVSGVVGTEAREVIRQVCRQHGCRLVEQGVDFDFRYQAPRHLELAPATGRLDFYYQEPKKGPGLICAKHPPGRSGKLNLVPFSAQTPCRYDDLPLALVGRHQAANAAVALAVLIELAHAGWKISERAVRAGLAGVSCPARVELVARRPAIVLDGAHNTASVDALVHALDESFSARRRLLVFATTQEKDARGMLSRLLGQFDGVVFTRYVDNPRAVPPEQLAALAAELGDCPHQVSENPADAWSRIREQATPDDLICITGSLFIAAEMRQEIMIGRLRLRTPFS